MKYLYYELYPGLLVQPKADCELQVATQSQQRFYQSASRSDSGGVSAAALLLHNAQSSRIERFVELSSCFLKKINRKNIKDMPYEQGFALSDSNSKRLEFSLPSTQTFKKWVKHLKKFTRLVGFFKKYVCISSLAAQRNFP